MCYSKIYIGLEISIIMDAICKVCSRPLMYTEYAVFGGMCEECWERELLRQEKKGERLAR
jgi:hypothetical protein